MLIPALTRRFELRLALANLHRPGAPLRATLLSLGSALTLLVANAMVVASLVRTINDTIPEESPGLVLYDVLDDQLDSIVAAIQQRPDAGTSRDDTTRAISNCPPSTARRQASSTISNRRSAAMRRRTSTISAMPPTTSTVSR